MVTVRTTLARSPRPSSRARTSVRIIRLVLVGVLATGVTGVAQAPDFRLIDAAKRGDLTATRRLLQQRVAAGAVATDGTTALHWASRGDALDVMRALVAAGAPASAADRFGITPLALAAQNGSVAATKLLLDAGANPNAASGEGETVLMTASRTGRPEVVQMLLARGARPNEREGAYGETALMWAAGQNHAAAIGVLAAGGADLNLRSRLIDLPPTKVDLATMVTTALPRGGMTALMYAARQGAPDAAAALADAGADLNAVDPDGVSALVLAIINAHFDVAARLVEKGADPNVADSAGMAALYAAVDMAHRDPFINRPRATPTGPPSAAGLVELLLARGAHPNQRLRAPLLMRQHNTGDASLGDGATPLMRAAKVPDLGLMRALMAGRADPSAALRNGTTTLMIVLGGRGPRAVTPETPLFQAVQLLLERGADVNAANSGGETALHQVVLRGEALVRLLASHGAKLDARDAGGRTPLDVALGVPAAVPAGRGRGGRGGGAPATPQRASDSTIALLKELGSGLDSALFATPGPP
jgi:ankyrin repeat protein